MKKYILPGLILATLLTFTGCATNTLSAPVSTETGGNTETVASAPSLATVGDIEATLEDIYTRVNPSVVNIRVTQNADSTLPSNPIPGLDIPHPSIIAEGSGFVWDDAGHIVTNNHVVDGADDISITLYDGTIVSGKVIGSDSDSDLAVIELDEKIPSLQPVQIADSTEVKVGQMAVAIGNSFGLAGTMTVGFVSGLGRLLPANESMTAGPSYSIPDVIQTDAAVNPGNSGGVLLDADGQLIGVTFSIATESGSSAGVGFAIPSAILQQVVPALIETVKPRGVVHQQALLRRRVGCVLRYQIDQIGLVRLVRRIGMREIGAP